MPDHPRSLFFPELKAPMLSNSFITAPQEKLVLACHMGFFSDGHMLELLRERISKVFASPLCLSVYQFKNKSRYALQDCPPPHLYHGTIAMMQSYPEEAFNPLENVDILPWQDVSPMQLLLSYGHFEACKSILQNIGHKEEQAIYCRRVLDYISIQYSDGFHYSQDAIDEIQHAYFNFYIEVGHTIDKDEIDALFLKYQTDIGDLLQDPQQGIFLKLIHYLAAMSAYNHFYVFWGEDSLGRAVQRGASNLLGLFHQYMGIDVEDYWQMIFGSAWWEYKNKERNIWKAFSQIKQCFADLVSFLYQNMDVTAPSQWTLDLDEKEIDKYFGLSPFDQKVCGDVYTFLTAYWQEKHEQFLKDNETYRYGIEYRTKKQADLDYQEWLRCQFDDYPVLM